MSTPIPARYEARKMLHENDQLVPRFGVWDSFQQSFVAYEVFEEMPRAINRARELNHVYARAV